MTRQENRYGGRDPKQTAELHAAWKAGDVEAGHDIIVGSLGLVGRMLNFRASKLGVLPGDALYLDMYQAGAEALVRCLSGFDPKKGDFEQYAKTRVRHAIFTEFNSAHSVVSRPKIATHSDLAAVLSKYGGNLRAASKFVKCSPRVFKRMLDEQRGAVKRTDAQLPEER